MPDEITVRPATPADRTAVANVLDGAALETDDDLLRTALEAGDLLVAEAADGDAGDGARVLGALVLDGEAVVAVAVRLGRRNQGIGTALVEAAANRRDRLVAECDPAVRPFWESLEFSIEPADDLDRLRGVR